MYNAAGSTLGSTGVATLAATGVGEGMLIVSFLAIALIALGGVLLMIGSRASKKKVDNEVS